MFYPLDYYYLILVVPALLFAAWAQAQVSGAYNRYSRVRVSRGMTGAMAARRILDDNGLTGVRVERVAGKLSDHYDPGERVVRLSAGVYDSDSVASLGVAAHECGHAVQHATHYAPLTFRNAIIPITNFGSKLSIPLIIVGLFLSGTLVDIGLLLFSLVAVFQLVTLPVEFTAPSRAPATLENGNFLDRRELEGARKVLRAAALTYVAALLVSVAQLMRLILLFGNRRRD